MSGRDRGEERRRLLDAVRTDAESASNSDGSGHEDRPEPAPDGGVVALDAPLFRCAACERSYLEAPSHCEECGAREFVEQRGP